MERERGFLERLRAKYPAIILVSADQCTGATRETARETDGG